MSEAVTECATRGSIVASGKDQEESDFVRDLVWAFHLIDAGFRN